MWSCYQSSNRSQSQHKSRNQPHRNSVLIFFTQESHGDFFFIAFIKWKVSLWISSVSSLWRRLGNAIILRAASISRCVECERVQISKHFKNKYSFQRHAFLYHEGAARKVFPCSICQKEFSRPDKMKQHLKQAHDGHPKANNVGSKNRAQTPPEEELPPSTLLINPFRGLSDPADMEGKISSIKESGSRC